MLPDRKPILLDEGWEQMEVGGELAAVSAFFQTACLVANQSRAGQVGIRKLKRLLEQEEGESNFTPDLYMHLYT